VALPSWYNQGDQNIYTGGQHYIPQENYRLNYTPNNLASTNTLPGITNTQAAGPYRRYPQGEDGDNIPEGNRIADFYTATGDRQNRLNNSGGQRSVNEMMLPANLNYSRSINDGITSFGLSQPLDAEGDFAGSGAFGNMPGAPTQDVRKTIGLPFGVGSLINKYMPDKYYDMDVADQAYIQSQMGYTDPNTNMANKDPFGINTRSAVGDYGAYTDKMADEEGDLAKLVEDQQKRGLTNTIQMRKLDFYQNQARQRNVIQHNVATQKKMRDAWEAETGREMDEADKRFKETGDYDEYSGAGGTPNYNIPAPTWSYEGSDQQDKDNEGSSTAADSGDWGDMSHMIAEGGRVGYNRGRVVNPGGYQGEEEKVDSVKHAIMLGQRDKLEKMIAAGLDSDGRLQARLDQLLATPTTGLGTGPDLVLPNENPDKEPVDTPAEKNWIQKLLGLAQGGRAGYFDGGIAGLL